MTGRPIEIRCRGTEGMPAYSIATLVTDKQQYAELMASFRNGGFAGDCEYLFIDNSGRHQTSAYAGLNALLDAARAPIVILCHQDVRLLTDGRTTLDGRLVELDKRDDTWAVAGNAGGVSPGRLALRITDPHGRDQHVGKLPERVVSLDENLLIVRRSADVRFSRDLEGFHLYGADICLNAAHHGQSAYVIDFHLEHLSAGRKGPDFAKAEAAFREKWSRESAPAWLQTTCTLLHLANGPFSRKLGHLAERAAARLVRRLPGARGWRQTAEPTR